MLLLVYHFIILPVVYTVAQIYFLFLRLWISSYHVHGSSRSSWTLILFSFSCFSQAHLSFLGWALMCVPIVARLLPSPYIIGMIRLHAMHMSTRCATISLELILSIMVRVWLLNLNSTSISSNCWIGGDAAWNHVVFQASLLTCLSQVVVAEFLVHY